jgi:hypothetical protein
MKRRLSRKTIFSIVAVAGWLIYLCLMVTPSGIGVGRGQIDYYYGFCQSFVITYSHGLRTTEVFHWRLALEWVILAALIFGTICGYRRFFRSDPPAGLCLSCGYDLRASQGECPECGAKIVASETKASVK